MGGLSRRVNRCGEAQTWRPGGQRHLQRDERGREHDQDLFPRRGYGNEENLQKYRQIDGQRVPANASGQTQLCKKRRAAQSSTTNCTMIRKIVQSTGTVSPRKNVLD